MRLVKLTYSWNSDNKGHWNLLLENKQDIIDYFELSSKKFSKDIVNFWFKAKETPTLSRLGHEVIPTNPAHSLAYHYISSVVNGTKNEVLTVQDYYQEMNKIQLRKLQNMLSIIDAGNIVRVNAIEGYSPFDETFKILEETELTFLQLISYLNGEHDFLNKSIFEINSDILIIENETIISFELLNLIKQLGINKYQLLKDFETVTFGYSEKDFIGMFSQGIENGLHTIILETTLIKRKQFNQLKSLIENLMKTKFQNKNLTVRILRNGFNKVITTEIKNYHEN